MPGLSFLIAAGLVAVPVIIHIFNRTRYRRINWAAMEFLLAAYRKTRRRVQLEHLLLLLLRILAMIFLAFAFFPSDIEKAALGALEWAGVSFTEGSDAGVSRHLVIVLDDTASMQYRDANRMSFERGIERATALVNSLREGRDRVTIVRATSVGVSRDAMLSEQENLQRLNREIRAVDSRRAVEQLGLARPSNAGADILAALREAGRRVESMDPERERAMVAVISDFQKTNWNFASAESGGRKPFFDLMASIDRAVTAAGERIRIIDIGPPVSANYGILDVGLSEPVLGVGIPARLRVTVGNFSAGGGREVSLRLKYRINQGEAIDFRGSGGSSVKLAPGEVRTVEERIPAFDVAGPQSIRVEIGERDLFEIDNGRTIAVNVIDAVPILIVNGSPATDIREDAAVFLMQALQISEGEGEDEAGRVTPNRVTLITPQALDRAAARLSDFAVVILANLSDPKPEFVQRLEEYVSIGGTVIFGMGSNVNPETWNERLYRDGAGLLPLALTREEGILQPGSNESPFRIGTGDYAPDSPLAFFADYQDLLTGNEWIYKWMGMREAKAEPSEGEEGEAQVVADSDLAPRVLLRINAPGNPPLLVQRRFGRGRSMVYATTVDDRWNFMWQAPDAFGIYLFHELIRASALGDRSRSNLQVGDHFIRVLREEEQTALGTSVVAPDGSTDRPVEVALADGRQQLVYSRTALPGLYRLRFLGEVGGRESTVREELFTVGVPPQESDVARLGGSEDVVAEPAKVLREALPGLNYSFEASLEERDAETAKAPASRLDVWLLMIGLASLCLLLEMGMTIWIGRRAE